MPNIIYVRNIPNPPNAPSADVNTMQNNANAISDIFTSTANPTVDNIGFNDANGGYHRQVSLLTQAAPGIPGGLGGVLYSDLNTGRAWPFWQWGNGAGQNFQITGSAAANSPSAAQNGYSFLPGGMIMQWGFKPSPGPFTSPINIDLTIAPHIPFPNAIFNTFAQLQSTGYNAIAGSSVYVGNLALNQISFEFTIPAGGFAIDITGLYWLAIGN